MRLVRLIEAGKSGTPLGRFLGALMRDFPFQSFIKWLSLLDKGATRAHQGQWDNTWRNQSVKRLASISMLCEQSGLVVTKDFAQSLMLTVSNPAYNGKSLVDEMAQLRSRMAAEVGTLVYLEIPQAQVYLWNAVEPYGPQVTAIFPEGRDDLEEAAKCLAVDRGSACVYHLMCAIDLALCKYSKHLKCAYDPRWEWNKVIEAIEDKIEPMPTKTRPKLIKKEQHLSVAAQLHAVRRAWRNPGMHSRRQYKPDEALEIFNATRGLMRDLVKVMK